jgi:hypothetical protein
VSPVKYELGFYITEDDILHSHRRENLTSYIVNFMLRIICICQKFPISFVLLVCEEWAGLIWIRETEIHLILNNLRLILSGIIPIVSRLRSTTLQLVPAVDI